MQTPVEIEFHGVESSPWIQNMLEEHVGELESRFGRITRCRVVVTGPGHHHRSGGLYDVRVHLSLPSGKEIAVDRVDHGDERYSDIRFAINDAFKRARRRIQDEARKLQGQTKHHEPQPAGTVVRIDPSGGFGFIAAPDGQEIYFHRNSVLNAAFDKLEPGARVTFVEEQGEKGTQASTVRLAGRHGPR
ncbi:HPF/RaiA family ribosome-associated protein [Chelativorans sp. AA-79]|uniref:HPF/RaiA family ribosome-associated protein n=1 Tax=Chelativorans sp. AA-79 TaxID=3028735 RepID=UPI0023F684DD|nr:HPF/RaiA family ribosome-associated protein [Chelativorans sp. AA-79]WEX10724.1 HPF/RaiA family ribosome-associated protein [Chelativorans sp. AA-79]